MLAELCTYGISGRSTLYELLYLFIGLFHLKLRYILTTLDQPVCYKQCISGLHEVV